MRLLIFRWKSSSLIRHSQAEVQKWTSFFLTLPISVFSFCLYSSLLRFVPETTEEPPDPAAASVAVLRGYILQGGRGADRREKKTHNILKKKVSGLFIAVIGSGVFCLNVSLGSPPCNILIIYWYHEWDLRYTTPCTYDLQELFGTVMQHMQHNVNVKHWSKPQNKMQMQWFEQWKCCCLCLHWWTTTTICSNCSAAFHNKLLRNCARSFLFPAEKSLVKWGVSQVCLCVCVLQKKKKVTGNMCLHEKQTNGNKRKQELRGEPLEAELPHGLEDVPGLVLIQSVND